MACYWLYYGSLLAQSIDKHEKLSRKTNSRERAKKRITGGPFIPLPIRVIEHPNYIALSTKAVKLLIDMCKQLHFKVGGPANNGDISIAWTLMSKRGWHSKETLRQAVLELSYYEFIQLTRQGGRNKCNLYAITWWARDECQGKLELKATAAPPDDWIKPKAKYQKKFSYPKTVPSYP